MEQFQITGMSCAACSARIEKAVAAVDGVTSCTVNLLTNSMEVKGTASAAVVIAAVEKAGYGAAVKGISNEQDLSTEDEFVDRVTPVLRRRLFWSAGFLLVLMYFSMGHMLGIPLPDFFHRNPAALGLIQLLLSAAVMVINQKFFVSGMKGLWHRTPNMDTLVALGSAASFGYSTVILFMQLEALRVGDVEKAAEYVHEFYFESAAMILTLITVGKMLEAYSKGKTTNALKGLMQLRPKTAVVEVSGEQRVIPIAQLKKGDIFVVKPGEHIPADGVVVRGSSAVNESALTGESIPTDKSVGDTVSAATVNQSGVLVCEAVGVGEDTALSKIIQMVRDASATKPPIAKAADRVSGIFVPVVMGIALVTFVVWLFLGESIGFSLARGISVLVISCPCALGLATPVAVMVGNGVGAKNGILFQNAAALEQTGKTEIVVLDKTGTITTGQPQVTDILPASGVTERQLLELAASLEQYSEHPLAGAVMQKAAEQDILPRQAESFEALTGSGVTAILDGKSYFGGKEALFAGKIPDALADMAEACSQAGKTPLYFGDDANCCGIIAVMDSIKPDSDGAIDQMKRMNLHVVMLTGDNPKTAAAIAAKVGVDEVIAGVLPHQKGEAVRSLKQRGRVMMVGDGINDAPALIEADVGAAIGTGTDIAIDAADVVLMKSRLTEVPGAIRLSRAVLRNIHENLFWAFIYNTIGIPLAAGVFITAFGWKLNPMFGAAAMSLSSVCVVCNALRLNWFHMTKADKRSKSKQEEKQMEKTVKIKGMMCPHCEGRVKAALEALDAVDHAEVSHEAGTAVVTLRATVEDAALIKAVVDAGYQAKI